MITILITAILLIVLSQIIASRHLSNVVMTDNSITKRQKVRRHFLSVLDWPLCATINLLFITDRRYRRNVIIIVSSIIICFLSIVTLWNQIERIPIKDLLETLAILAVVWWLLDYIIGGIIKGANDGTLFDD